MKSVVKVYCNITHYSAIYATGSSGLFSRIIEITSCICRVTPTRAGNLIQITKTYYVYASVLVHSFEFNIGVFRAIFTEKERSEKVVRNYNTVFLLCRTAT